MSPTPRWYLPTVIAALVWNLIGCAAYLHDVMLTPEDLAKMAPEAQAMYAARPAWSVAATAIAVWGGAFGCIALILRKRWATPLLVASLVAVIVQDVSIYAMSVMHGALNPVVLVLQGIVIAIGVGLVLLARKATSRGWLT